MTRKQNITTVYLLFAILLPFTGYPNWQGSLITALDTKPECIEQAIGSREVVIKRQFDIDDNNKPDEVYIYRNGSLHVLIALDSLDTNCRIVLDTFLTNVALVTGSQKVDVHQIETVELTGDAQPELHIWLDKTGGGRHVAATVHTIYASSSDGWREVFHLEQCQAFNSFRFQNSPTAATKDIYRDTDIQCETPFSQSRTYDIWHWDGASFMLVESGTINTWSLYPPIWYVICISVLLCPLIALLLISIRIRKVKR